MRFKLRCGLVVEEMAYSDLQTRIESRKGGNVHICTANPEMAEWYLRDVEYRSIVDAADLRTIDGIGIVVALYRQYRKATHRLTGVMLVKSLVDIARTDGRGIIIVGASAESRAAVEASFREQGLRVHEGFSPEFTDAGQPLDLQHVRAIPDGSIVLVALGIPKQERWIRTQIGAAATVGCVYAGIGGAIDYLSGRAIFAPEWLRRMGLEWAFRLALEPRKRLGRQARTLPRFVLREILS
jgi:N-acetylglucosaminyldiphosphoundecaprenol N-acetyl-beta-D-mannosaminyltransferase